MHTNPVLDRLGSYPIAELQEKARSMRAEGRPLIDFSVGDPREPTPGFIPEALKGSVPAVSQYPTTSGLPELRRAVADYVQRRFGVRVDPDRNVLPTAGSKEAIFSTPLAFVDRSAGDAVIWATPGYPIYERGALLAGARGHAVTLSGDFVLRPDQIPDPVWDSAAIVWTNYPHNPTGALASRADIEAMYQKARSTNTWFMADECYVDVYEDVLPPSVLQVADDSLEGVLSYLSLSKRSGMTGYRSAAIVGDATAIAALRALRTSTGTASPEFVQGAAIAAWADDDHVAERRGIFARKRAVLRAAFEQLGHEVVASRAGLYLWVSVGDDVAVAERLLRGGVLVSPGRAFGAGGEGFIRLALVPTLEESEHAVEVLTTCLTGN
ncbi:MAG TPA: aminotransferase class I/II-fold pyridoxal phosphate-dependent enzyme [Acidimicrobiia bacterium]|nr:aminotransferase class I/II-fold pyridoxal phosphate-dependent enzyme [Acidimicrobiia bacterium]